MTRRAYPGFIPGYGGEGAVAVYYHAVEHQRESRVRMFNGTPDGVSAPSATNLEPPLAPDPFGFLRSPQAMLVRRNAALVATWSAFALFVVKILVVSHYDLTVALGLVAVDNVAQVAAGVALLTASDILAGGIILALIGAWMLRRAGRPVDTVVAGFLAIVAVISLGDWSAIAIGVGALLAAPCLAFMSVLLPEVLAFRFPLRWRETLPRFRARLSPQMFAIAVIVLIFLSVVDDTVWLPPEEIGISRQKPFVGYIVSRDDSWTTVLRDSDRALEVLQSSGVTSQTPCELTFSGFLDFTGFLRRRPLGSRPDLQICQ